MNRQVGLLALLSADVISALGNRVSVVAIPWLVLVTTGSPAKMGLIAAAEMVPYVLSAVFAAPLADRFGLRRTSVLTDVGSAAATAAIAAVPQLGFEVLVVLVAATGALRGIGDRAKHVLLKPMADVAGARMVRVMSVYEGLTRGATLLGAPLGGLLIVWFGPTGAIWVDAVSFAVCGLLVLGLVRPPSTAQPDEPAVREPYLRALWSGARYLRRDRLLFGMHWITFTVNLFAAASIAVFIPLWVEHAVGSAAALGLILGSFAAGAVVGNLVFTVVAPKLPLRQTFVLGALIGGAPRLLVLGMTDALTPVLIVTFLSGVGIAAINPVMGTLLYERIPPTLQTRVFGLSTAFSFVGLAFGGLLAGWAVTGVGMTPAILVGGGICLVVTLLPLFGIVLPDVSKDSTGDGSTAGEGAAGPPSRTEEGDADGARQTAELRTARP